MCVSLADAFSAKQQTCDDKKMPHMVTDDLLTWFVEASFGGPRPLGCTQQRTDLPAVQSE